MNILWLFIIMGSSETSLIGSTYDRDISKSFRENRPSITESYKRDKCYTYLNNLHKTV